jgi:hypothetical protein
MYDSLFIVKCLNPYCAQAFLDADGRMDLSELRKWLDDRRLHFFACAPGVVNICRYTVARGLLRRRLRHASTKKEATATSTLRFEGPSTKRNDVETTYKKRKKAVALRKPMNFIY